MPTGSQTDRKALLFLQPLETYGTLHHNDKLCFSNKKTTLVITRSEMTNEYKTTYYSKINCHEATALSRDKLSRIV